MRLKKKKKNCNDIGILYYVVYYEKTVDRTRTSLRITLVFEACQWFSVRTEPRAQLTIT